MTEKPAYAPGCYGSAIFFTGEGVCATCAFAAECKPVHLEAQRQLREFLGVTVAPKRKVDGLPVKVKKIFDDLNITKEEVRDKMLSGQNPFTLTAGFMGVVCHALLQRQSLQRSSIERLVGHARSVTPETAYYYVRSAVQILHYCDVVAFDNTNVRLCAVDDK